MAGGAIGPGFELGEPALAAGAFPAEASVVAVLRGAGAGETTAAVGAVTACVEPDAGALTSMGTDGETGDATGPRTFTGAGDWVTASTAGAGTSACAGGEAACTTVSMALCGTSAGTLLSEESGTKAGGEAAWAAGDAAAGLDSLIFLVGA